MWQLFGKAARIGGMNQEIDGRKQVKEEANWYAVSEGLRHPVGWLVAALLGLGFLFFGKRKQK
ncbi:hypothetical protein [Deinococcus xinjiangensis]